LGSGKKRNFITSVREITELLPLVGYKGLRLDDETTSAELQKEGQAVDLGGIAKGYAADEVKRILMENGITSAMINLGGNIAALGCRPDGKPWRIGIQNPLSPTGEFLAVIPVEDGAVVTSGSNERFFIEDGVRYHHIIDPRTGRPARSGLLSVTVVCGNSADADALTTALFVLDREGGMKLLEITGTDAVFVSESLEITAIGGLAGKIEIQKGSCVE
jgi:FAD:protein FMN transferase